MSITQYTILDMVLGGGIGIMTLYDPVVLIVPDQIWQVQVIVVIVKVPITRLFVFILVLTGLSEGFVAINLVGYLLEKGACKALGGKTLCKESTHGGYFPPDAPLGSRARNSL